jgi:preprotein translocase subunit SecE
MTAGAIAPHRRPRFEGRDVNDKLETQVSRFDSIKLGGAALIIVAAVGAFYYYGEQPLFLRVLGLLIAAGLALIVALQAEAGRNFANFVLQARDEVRKVVWPTRKETVQTTMVIIATVLVVAVLLWLMDMVLLWGARLLTGHGG